MKCEIEWNKLSLEEWENRFSSTRRANLLQSYQYAQAVCPIYKQKARWGLIKIDGAEAGLIQMLETGIIKNILHTVAIDRGPLWFKGYGDKEHQEVFFKAINQEFPERFGRKRRVIPETERHNAPSFEKLGYRKKDSQAYETIWLDLNQTTDVLRSNLDKKWRNMLKKAEKSALKILWEEDTENLLWLLTNYQSDKAKKGYSGPSVRILRALGKTFGENGRLLIGRALLDNQDVAAILILVHGSSATYQLGWNSDKGRNVAAHNLLLWQAVCQLKEKAIFDFDLGGVNDDTAKGVKKFKEGMGGQTVSYIGHYF